MAKPRATQLEDEKWTDKVFTGDSHKNVAALTFHARQREMETMNDRYKGRQTTVDPTIEEKLFNRVKPWNVKQKTDTLEDKIDLYRVKDARKAFRRRYASRTNAETIFNDCDGGRKGYLDAHDIHKQAGKIGIGISLDEAQVLL